MANLSSLLAADEPPALRLIAAQTHTNLVLLCDHASRAVPRALGDLGVARAEWDRHIAWDIGALGVAEILAQRFGCALVHSNYSRLVLDCNRRLDDPGLCPTVSDGTRVPGNEDLDAAARNMRVDALHLPYHAAIRDVLAGIRKCGAVPIVVSMHSCTPVFKGFVRPWHIGVLWRSDPRLPVPLMTRLRGLGGIEVGDNQPYDARDGHGFTMREHCEQAGYPHALIEIRQDLIDTHSGIAKWADLFGQALAPLLASDELRRIEVYP
jgi:predicted N-formylglutamate amidohydrolase